MSDIMFFYLLFPWLYKNIIMSSKKQLAMWCTFVTTILAIIIIAIPEKHITTVLYTFPPIRAINFALGIVVYRFYKSNFTESLIHKIKNKDKYLTAALETTTIAVITATFGLYSFFTPKIGCMVFYLIPVSTLIYISSVTDRGTGILTRSLHDKLLLRLGALSMEIFMIHMFVIRIFIILRNHHLFSENLIINIFSVLATTIIAAYITKKYYADKIYSIFKEKYLSHE